MNNRQSPGATPPGELSPAQWSRLLALAGQSLGANRPDGSGAEPDAAAERLARSMTPEQSRRLQQVLSDPEETRRLLSSKQAQRLFELLGKK